MDIRPFGPRMKSEIGGFTIVGDLKWRAWGGIVADIWDVRCGPGARGRYLSPDPRLFVPLALEGGGAFRILQDDGKVACAHNKALTMSYIPANHAIDGEAVDLSRMKHLDIHLSEIAIRRRFGRPLKRDALAEPRFSLDDPRLAMLARLVAEEVEAARPSHDLYLDGLVNALLAALFDIRPEPAERRRPALSRAQLREAMDYIDAHCLETIRLTDLAGLVGLSESYFSHAFKAAAGVSPHRWVMQVRIRKAQDLLRDTDLAVSAVAAQCGFADQAHFNRVFRSVTGLTPGVWKREQ